MTQTPEAPQSYSVFQERWWLEALAPGAISEVKVEREGRVVARWPFQVKRRMGLTILTQPPITQAVGPWFAPMEGKPSRQFGEYKELFGQLVDQLPPHDFMAANCDPALVNSSPFRWKGFRQTTAYTYTIENTGDLDAVWKGFEDAVRNQIRKAEKALTVVPAELEEMLEVQALTFRRQGLDEPFPRDLGRRMDAACSARGVGHRLKAVDAEGRTHAVIYVVEDQAQFRGIFSGADPEFRNSGATSFLFWKVMHLAGSRGKAFNFGGSMVEGIEAFMRRFGGRPVPYLVCTRASTRMRILLGLKDGWDALRGRPWA